MLLRDAWRSCIAGPNLCKGDGPEPPPDSDEGTVPGAVLYTSNPRRMGPVSATPKVQHRRRAVCTTCGRPRACIPCNV